MPRAAFCPTCESDQWLTADGCCSACSASISGGVYRAVPRCSSPPGCPPAALRSTDVGKLRVASDAVDVAWSDLLRARSIVPAPGPAAKGSVNYTMPPFYTQWSLNPSIVMFERPLTAADVEQLRTSGHSINEGHVLRLHAILDAAGLLQWVLDPSVPHERTVLLLGRLRNEIAHGRRYYEQDDKQRTALLSELLAVLYPDDLISQQPLLAEERRSIESSRDCGDPFLWPLSILGALMPLTRAVKEFIDEAGKR